MQNDRPSARPSRSLRWLLATTMVGVTLLAVLVSSALVLLIAVLFVVQRIVEAHGGRIEVASTPGQGSTFRVRLPAGAPP